MRRRKVNCCQSVNVKSSMFFKDVNLGWAAQLSSIMAILRFNFWTAQTDSFKVFEREMSFVLYAVQDCEYHMSTNIIVKGCQRFSSAFWTASTAQSLLRLKILSNPSQYFSLKTGGFFLEKSIKHFATIRFFFNYSDFFLYVLNCWIFHTNILRHLMM